MQIGVISDTHDNLPKIEKAVELFNKNKVGFVLHAGDFVAPFTALKLKKLKCDWRGVFGNNDGEKAGLSRVSEGKIREGPLRIELADKKIILVHDIKTVDLTRENAELVIFGHTHKQEIIKKNNLFLINPGEAGGWLTASATCAIVDLADLSHKIVSL